MPSFFDNINSKVVDDLKVSIKKGTKLSIASACFSIYAFEELRFIFTTPSFLKDGESKQRREFYIPRIDREMALYGSQFEVKLRNQLTQKAIAIVCAEWIRSKVKFKSNITSANMLGATLHLPKHKGVTCRQADDSRTDGIGVAQLSFPIMSFHIDYPAVNHPKVASDTHSLARLFLTDYCKALSRAFSVYYDFHIKMIISNLRTRSCLSGTPSVSFKNNRAFISIENKYPVVTARELAFSQIA